MNKHELEAERVVLEWRRPVWLECATSTEGCIGYSQLQPSPMPKSGLPVES